MNGKNNIDNTIKRYWRPLLFYVIVQFIFSLIYQSQWQHNPCSFLLNEDFNEDPIEKIRSVVSNDKKPNTYLKHENIALSELSRKLYKLVDNLNTRQEDEENLQKEVDSFHIDIQNYLEQDDIIQDNEIDKYISKNTEQFRVNVKEKQEVVENVKISYNSVKKSKIELANTQLELTKKILEELGNAKDNLEIVDHKWIKQMSVFNKYQLKLEKELINNHRSIDKAYNELKELNRIFIHNRSVKLKYIDFVYFSFITSTTTGYGDIVPNNRFVRFLVLIQVVISLIIFAFVIQKMTDLFNSSQMAEKENRDSQLNEIISLLKKSLRLKNIKRINGSNTKKLHRLNRQRQTRTVWKNKRSH